MVLLCQNLENTFKEGPMSISERLNKLTTAAKKPLFKVLNIVGSPLRLTVKFDKQDPGLAWISAVWTETNVSLFVARGGVQMEQISNGKWVVWGTQKQFGDPLSAAVAYARDKAS